MCIEPLEIMLFTLSGVLSALIVTGSLIKVVAWHFIVFNELMCVTL